VATRLLDIFRSGSDLVHDLWLDVVYLLAGIEKFAGFLKVVFHQVNVCIVIAKVYARVFNQQDTELMEALGNLLAFQTNAFGQVSGLDLVIFLECFKENLEINDGHVCKVCADKSFSGVDAVSVCRLV